jgi:hypothetical protein
MHSEDEFAWMSRNREKSFLGDRTDHGITEAHSQAHLDPFRRVAIAPVDDEGEAAASLQFIGLRLLKHPEFVDPFEVLSLAVAHRPCPSIPGLQR